MLLRRSVKSHNKASREVPGGFLKRVFLGDFVKKPSLKTWCWFFHFFCFKTQPLVFIVISMGRGDFKLLNGIVDVWFLKILSRDF